MGGSVGGWVDVVTEENTKGHLHIRYAGRNQCNPGIPSREHTAAQCTCSLTGFLVFISEVGGLTMVMMAFLSLARRPLCSASNAPRFMLETVSPDTSTKSCLMMSRWSISRRASPADRQLVLTTREICHVDHNHIHIDAACTKGDPRRGSAQRMPAVFIRSASLLRMQRVLLGCAGWFRALIRVCALCSGGGRAIWSPPNTSAPWLRARSKTQRSAADRSLNMDQERLGMCLDM